MSLAGSEAPRALDLPPAKLHGGTDLARGPRMIQSLAVLILYHDLDLINCICTSY